MDHNPPAHTRSTKWGSATGVILICFGGLRYFLEEPSYYDFFNLHIFLNGLLLLAQANLLKSSREQKNLLERWIPLLGFGSAVINICVPVALIFNRWPSDVNSLKDTSDLWVFLIALPGILGFWLYFGYLNARDKEPDEPADEEEPSYREQRSGYLHEDDKMSRPHPLVNLVRWAKVAWVLFVWSGIMVSSLFLGYLYFYLLRDSILKKVTYDWSLVHRIISNLRIEDILLLLLLPTVLFALYFLWGIISSLGLLAVQLSNRNSDRHFNQTEEEYIDNAHTALLCHLENMTTPSSIVTFYWFGGFVFVAGIIGGGIGIFALDAFIIKTLEPFRTNGLDWYLYVDEFGVSGVIAIFWIIFVLGSIGQIVVWFIKDAGPYFALQTEQISGTAEETSQGYPTLRALIARFVRYRKLDPKNPFDPHDFLNKAFHTYDKLVHGATLTITALVLFFAWHDYNDYYLFTEDFIETVDYWTLEKHRYDYNQVDHVEVKCRVSKDDGVYIDYDIVMTDGQKVELFDDSSFLKNLSKIGKVDAKIIAAGAYFTALPYTTEFGKTFDSYQPGCETELVDRYGNEIARQAKQLLHLAEVRPD